MNYRPEIDGLRTLAVVPVILFHAGFAWFGGGYIGVDVFFVISGYLITTLILGELNRDQFNLINFYERRARRILPALFFVVLVCIPVAWVLLLPGELRSFAQSVVAVATFTSNILFWLQSGYFDSAAELKPLLHTWSLAVEEQYYIVFPLLLLLLWRFGRFRLLMTLSLLFIASLALAQWRVYTEPDAAFFLLTTRSWELLVGVFVAFFLQSQPEFGTSRIYQAGSLIGLGLILIAVFGFDESTPVPGLYGLVPTLGGALIILCARKGTLVHSVLSFKAMVFVGLISYSAYLWHQPLLVFTRYSIAAAPTALVLLSVILTTFVLAAFTYQFIEKPFRNREFLLTRQVFNNAGYMVFGFVFLGLLLINVDTIASRNAFNEFAGDTGHSAFHEHIEQANFPCRPETIYNRAETWDGFVRCHQSLEAPAEIVLFGDSHAEHFYIGLAEGLNNTSVAYYIRGGYPFVGEPEYDYLIEYISTSAEIEYIIYAGFWRWIAATLGEDEFRSRLEATLAAFKLAGKQVVLVADVPEFQLDPQHRYCANGVRLSKCEITREVFESQGALYLPVLADIAQEQNIELIQIDDLFCDVRGCSKIRNREILFRDDHHLNIPASRQAGAEIIRRSPTLSSLLDQ